MGVIIPAVKKDKCREMLRNTDDTYKSIAKTLGMSAYAVGALDHRERIRASRGTLTFYTPMGLFQSW